MESSLKKLGKRLYGELRLDETSRILYSTDASAYREKPLAVFIPKDNVLHDIRLLLDFCKRHDTFIIPRAAGTSLAGQVVGNGIVCDVSKYLNRILELNVEERWVRVQPGVVLEELNSFLKPYGLFFAPETSTANRCCIGGMVGNNSCGLHSLVYNSTREHLLEARVVLSDGSQVLLKRLDRAAFEDKSRQDDFEGRLYAYIASVYSNPETVDLIKANFPEADVKRRNNGYALDSLLDLDNCNLAKLFAGSEGTLGFATEFKLNLLPLPPGHKSLLCVHFDDLQDCFSGNLTALRHNPMAVEMMDDNIIEAAYRNTAQRKNTFFIKGRPKALLVIEFACDEKETLQKRVEETIEDFRHSSKAYAYSVVEGEDMGKVWTLRKAGLGLLSNVPGDCKPVSVIEDTAVSPYKLPKYMEEFSMILKKYSLQCVYHAHIATGELHLRPIVNLKEKDDVDKFRSISKDIAVLVKKYRGSLSGEHGDGRLRGEWIPLMYGEEIYGLMRQMKHVWDPQGVFNRGKITDTPPMNGSLRYENYNPGNINTFFSFEKEKGFLCAVEQCNGSADCRKSNLIGGLMCPTFKVTQNEWDTPRSRANIIRETITFSESGNPFSSKRIKNVLDNCLMCKACKSECPSNVDITKLKSEFLQHYYSSRHYPISVLLVNMLPDIQRLFSHAPSLYNWMVSNKTTSFLVKSLMRFTPERPLPKISVIDFEKTLTACGKPAVDRKIYLYIDEFSVYQDANVTEVAIKLFSALGYEVTIAPVRESGRIAISKGWVKRAKSIAERNVEILEGFIDKEHPMVGLEPSALLSFRDEYPDLVNRDISGISENVYLFDEFFIREMEAGNITEESFTRENKEILLHGHCQQKALIGSEYMRRMLSLPENFNVKVIPGGCCGMAGSYGYEKRHYKMSRQIAELALLPAIRQAGEDVLISAPGTSCREQIRHLAKRQVFHPVEIMYDALKNK